MSCSLPHFRVIDKQIMSGDDNTVFIYNDNDKEIKWNDRLCTNTHNYLCKIIQMFCFLNMIEIRDNIEGWQRMWSVNTTSFTIRCRCFAFALKALPSKCRQFVTVSKINICVSCYHRNKHCLQNQSKQLILKCMLASWDSKIVCTF